MDVAETGASAGVMVIIFIVTPGGVIVVIVIVMMRLMLSVHAAMHALIFMAVILVAAPSQSTHQDFDDQNSWDDLANLMMHGSRLPVRFIFYNKNYM